MVRHNIAEPGWSARPSHLPRVVLCPYYTSVAFSSGNIIYVKCAVYDPYQTTTWPEARILGLYKYTIKIEHCVRVYIYIYVCVCVCVRACVRARERVCVLYRSCGALWSTLFR